MPQIDPQLVQQIADQVLVAMGQGGLASIAVGSAAPTPIHAPAGACTGDLSKYVDRPDLARGQVQHTSSAPIASSEPQPEPAALSGIVTAQQLQDAMKADGLAYLAPTARLTPLAQDLAKEQPEKVQRLTVAANPTAMAIGSNRFAYWVDGHCPAVQSTVATLGSRLVMASASATGRQSIQVVADLARSVAGRQSAGGILFVRSAHMVNAAANRCPTLRAVVCNCLNSLEQAIADVAPNVLIVEYPYVPAGTIHAMADRFTRQAPSPAPHLLRELSQLQRTPA